MAEIYSCFMQGIDQNYGQIMVKKYRDGGSYSATAEVVSSLICWEFGGNTFITEPSCSRKSDELIY